MATRLCPCGQFGEKGRACKCTPRQVGVYGSRVSGPLLDRMDLQVHVPPVAPGALAAGAATGATSADLRAAVVAVRALQAPRGCLNSGLSLAALDRHAPLDREGEEYLQRMARVNGLSARALVRIRRLARTLADLRGSPRVEHDDLAEAGQFRVVREA